MRTTTTNDQRPSTMAMAHINRVQMSVVVRTLGLETPQVFCSNHNIIAAPPAPVAAAGGAAAGGAREGRGKETRSGARDADASRAPGMFF
jgi:hypothetical protein